eukprot:TRINITY_DN28397_c0_g1_i1.p1 TRINITY_DN28397_c0_g1~~TRINITY_DN28397_c0_g1_i1.p1  ORF type:complete len:750 (-),score=154.43 TRINITY_DN28397_c0_g1_i1:9-2258(-)
MALFEIKDKNKAQVKFATPEGGPLDDTELDDEEEEERRLLEQAHAEESGQAKQSNNALQAGPSWGGANAKQQSGSVSRDEIDFLKNSYFSGGFATRMVINPCKKPVLRWNMLVLFLLLIEAPLLPWRLAFVPESTLPESPWLFYYSIYVDMVMWMDCALQFFLEVTSPDRSHWINKPKVIAKTYVRSGLFLDLVSVLPLKFFFMIFSDHQAQECQNRVESEGFGKDTGGLVQRCVPGILGPCSIAALSFHKLARFGRMTRVLKILQNHDLVSTFFSAFKHWQKVMGRSFMITVVSVHTMGCLWAMQARCGKSMGLRTWLDFMSESPGRDDSGIYDHSNVFGVYLCSLYWAVYTLTGIGYGDIVPVSLAEYILSIICMFCGSMLWAWVMASLVSIMSTMNQANNENMQLLDAINGLLDRSAVTAKLRERLREYVAKMRDLNNEDDFATITKRFSPNLKVQLVYVVHKDLISQVWWLSSIPWRTGLVVDMTEAMCANMHTPGELIPNKAQLVQIRTGLCIRGGRLLGKGKVYGEDFLLENPLLRRPDLVFVLTFLHTLVMERPHFFAMLHRYPDVEKLVRKSYVQLILIRGIQNTARERKREMLHTVAPGEKLASPNQATSELKNLFSGPTGIMDVDAHHANDKAFSKRTSTGGKGSKALPVMCTPTFMGKDYSMHAGFMVDEATRVKDHLDKKLTVIEENAALLLERARALAATRRQAAAPAPGAAPAPDTAPAPVSAEELLPISPYFAT